MKLEKLSRRARRTMKQIADLMDGRAFRLVVAHPDMCLYMNRWPSFTWRYLRREPSRWTHFVICFAWLEVVIPLKSRRT